MIKISNLTCVRQWRIPISAMQFIETKIFTRQVTTLLTDDEYSQLQVALSAHPDAGAIIPHSGGLRKRKTWRSKSYLLLGFCRRSNSYVVYVSKK